MTRWSASVRKLQRALMTMELDGAGEGSGKACWVLMRGARADMFGCASHRENFPVASKTCALAAEKTGHVLVRTRPHPGPREPQRFQSLTNGYVRRSEVIATCLYASISGQMWCAGLRTRL